MNRIRIIILFIFLLLLSLVFGEMINPSNQKSLSYIHVLFEWDQEADAVEYELQISENQSFSSMVSVSYTHLTLPTNREV